jgi:cysteine desulfurase
MQTIYLDNNATTPVLPEVWEAMRPYFTDVPGNPASSHAAGRRARQALEDARDLTARVLGASPAEVIFTSGATEANNLALFGLAGSPPGHLLVSAVEHPCVIEPMARLAKMGFEVERIPVDAQGVVSEGAFARLLRPDTWLVSVMLANHETGAVQPVAKLASRVGEGTRFHCDAAAAAGKMPVHFHDLQVTALTVSAHKLHGPKGVGALLVRKGERLTPLLWGGHQQQGRRPGTEPVALAVGLAAALDLAVRAMEIRRDKVTHLRRLFLDRLRATAAPVVVNGPEEGGVPHTLNLSFPGCRADLLLMNLDLAGVACSTGSACSSGSLLPSPVIQAIGVTDEVLHSAIRFSFSALLSEEEVEEAAQRVAPVVKWLRDLED